MPNRSSNEAPAGIGEVGREVAFNVRLLRRLNNWDQRELAELMTGVGRRMSLSSLSDTERGTRRIDVDDLVAFAGLLGVTPEALMRPFPRPSATRPD